MAVHLSVPLVVAACDHVQNRNTVVTVADPGFPVGGAWTSWGGVDPRDGYVSKILYVKMKESGPLGACAGHAPSRSANGRALGTPPRSPNGKIRPQEIWEFMIWEFM